MGDPENVALMGNFDVTNVSPTESWVTVGEWMPRSGYRGDVLLARIHWATPNRLPPMVTVAEFRSYANITIQQLQ